MIGHPPTLRALAFWGPFTPGVKKDSIGRAGCPLAQVVEFQKGLAAEEARLAKLKETSEKADLERRACLKKEQEKELQPRWGGSDRHPVLMWRKVR